MIEKLKDRYLTWRTGNDKITRDWIKWRDEIINHRAGDVHDYFVNFRYIFEVDSNKVWNHTEPFAWVTVEDFKQYEYPQRQLGDNAVVSWFRGSWNQWDSRFHLDEFGGGDHVFVATNNADDAMMIALKYK